MRGHGLPGGSQVDLPSDVKELTKLGSREGGHDKTITALAFDYERMSVSRICTRLSASVPFEQARPPRL